MLRSEENRQQQIERGTVAGRRNLRNAAKWVHTFKNGIETLNSWKTINPAILNSEVEAVMNDIYSSFVEGLHDKSAKYDRAPEDAIDDMIHSDLDDSAITESGKIGSTFH
mmetsp:Transcript_2283/g.2919  ORF Transcript_2283/g.2919 Transcript_2283/m.2919 type:complete len:110 (-) Transcript_2283:56-385(-)